MSLFFLLGISHGSERIKTTIPSIHLLLLKDEAGLVPILRGALNSDQIQFVVADNRPVKLQQGELLAEGMTSYQPRCQGYESPFGKFGIPDGYQSRSMEANLKISGHLKNGLKVEEHWVFESKATDLDVSKSGLAKDLAQSVAAQFTKLLLAESSVHTP